MSIDEYRRHAAECLRIAEEVIDSRYRISLVNMAESWLRLAQQAEKNAGHQSGATEDRNELRGDALLDPPDADYPTQ